MDLKTEIEKLNELRTKNESAQSDYKSKLDRDAVREDGSPRQDALHEEILRKSGERAGKAHGELVAQEKVVAELTT